MEKQSIQVQAVLYNNEKSALGRAMESLEQAAIVNRKRGGPFSDIVFACGDASPQPIFNQMEMEALQARYNKAFSLSYTFFGSNTGSAKGHNLLGKGCKSDYMMTMNPDVLLCPRFFIEIMRPFADETLQAGLVEGRQTPVEHPKNYDIKTGETSWAATACAVFPTGLFHDLRGFDDETFFLYCDDVDFSWRVRMADKQVIYQPHAIAFHAKRLSSAGGWQPTSAERYYSAEAALLMSYKWSNDELCGRLLEQFAHGPDEDPRRAAQEFERRRKEGRLPKQLDKEHRVATFQGDFYADHRFVL